jgi:hypothetical protein
VLVWYVCGLTEYFGALYCHPLLFTLDRDMDGQHLAHPHSYSVFNAGVVACFERCYVSSIHPSVRCVRIYIIATYVVLFGII